MKNNLQLTHIHNRVVDIETTKTHGTFLVIASDDSFIKCEKLYWNTVFDHSLNDEVCEYYKSKIIVLIGINQISTIEVLDNPRFRKE